MALRYQIVVQCKARAPSGAAISIGVGSYSVIGDEPGHTSVRLVDPSHQIDVTYAEFQRLKAAGFAVPLQPLPPTADD
jgi:hypothetical protein